MKSNRSLLYLLLPPAVPELHAGTYKEIHYTILTVSHINYWDIMGVPAGPIPGP